VNACLLYLIIHELFCYNYGCGNIQCFIFSVYSLFLGYDVISIINKFLKLWVCESATWSNSIDFLFIEEVVFAIFKLIESIWSGMLFLLTLFEISKLDNQRVMVLWNLIRVQL